jgi:hypothetical protein
MDCRMRGIFWAFSLFCVACPVPALAQASTAPRAQVTGTVGSVTASANQFALKTDKGDTITVTTTERTVILHLPPGVTDATKGTKMTIGELAAGDRVVAIYRGAPDDKAVQATSVVVRTSADLGEIAKAELADWRKRGTVGIVTETNPAAKTITLKVGSKTITVNTTDKTEYHRYSLDSAKPADAKPSSFAEIKAGDQVHVLGNKNEDGTATTGESIYAGMFRQLAATIKSINAATGEIQVLDLATKKPLTIRVDSDSTMKKLDAQQADSLARSYGAGRGQNAPAVGAGGGAPGRGGRGGRGGDVGQMLDRLPAVQVSDLKAGDAVMVSTTMGSDPTHVTVIMLLAGVEPLLTASPNATRDIMSGWNLSGGSGGEGN